MAPSRDDLHFERKSTAMKVHIIQADYSDQTQAQQLRDLLDAYASDPMGGGQPLKTSAKMNLISELARRPYAFSIIAYLDNQPVGLANCFEGFSTFASQPLINIHDFMVVAEHRGKGISQQMLDKIEEIAREKNCCKITLEVLSKNHAARSAYSRFGFHAYQLDPATGTAEFWQKQLG